MAAPSRARLRRRSRAQRLLRCFGAEMLFCCGCSSMSLDHSALCGTICVTQTRLDLQLLEAMVSRMGLRIGDGSTIPFPHGLPMAF